ncbi:hypothetical protein BDB01DRAFT_784189 [Pilobolus umbonatus]|nr:hypothetical protein BDB01DRAFT_784189 [Pilobolus umbonatus]
MSRLDEELTGVVPASYIEGGLGCPDCSVSFSLKHNLRAHLLRVHQKKVELVNRFKGGRVAASRRYHEKNYKPVERYSPPTPRQLAMAANYKKRKEQKLAGILKAEV